jgi:hypothetical protein
MSLGGYLFLNDATGEDGAQEYAVVKVPENPGDPYRQVESITMSWCTEEKALGYILKALAGEYDGDGWVIPTPRLDTPTEHGSCHLCM